MLTARENMRRCVKNEGPDRYVNQYEALKPMSTPLAFHNPRPRRGEADKVNAWGVTYSYPMNVPAGFPVHTPDKLVVKDIENWRDYVKAPSLDWPEEEWEKMEAAYASVDRTKAYACTFVTPGIFEQTHHLCSIDQVLLYYMINEEEMTDMIKYITEWELKFAEKFINRLHPDAILHHDDWGSETNTFLRPSMFDDYFLEPYKQIYGYYHDHGVELIIHHSDSYGANIVPEMIEMGIDVWQGPMHTNNVPELVKKWGKQITFMGEIDNKFVDFDNATYDDCVKAARNAIESVGTMEGFIPCITQGGPGSLYVGGYEGLWQAIDEYNIEKFGYTQEEIDAARLPLSVMMPGSYRAKIECKYNDYRNVLPDK
ncbi:MAG: uroporphyrinogen decarboxylase [Firmicutes bacterium]|nr:uroporphyrinogen decarboxylase [Bacillota bacterium]MBQ2042025.1 uroporphyrinogen decarboxylase [Bacillota bacterium]